MKLFKQEDGFTLVELLASINIAFIALAIFTSFYLFINKYFNTSIKYEEAQNAIYDFKDKLKSTLKKCNYFTLSFYPDSLTILTDNGHTVTFALNDIVANYNRNLHYFDDYSVTVYTDNDKSIKAGSDKTTFFNNFYLYKNNFSINDIEKIEIVINYKNKAYSIQYMTPDVANKRFKNISFQ